MRRVLLLSVGIFFACIALAWAAHTLSIGDQDIPLIEGAVAVDERAQLPLKARCASYKIDLPLRVAVEFYSSFFNTNAFLVIGGIGSDGSFDASVKKESTHFTLRIFKEGGVTRLRFIW